MGWTLFDGTGRRKYLTRTERLRFVRSALNDDAPTRLFCLTLAITGGRVSEVLQLTRERIDSDNGVVVIETLKRRSRGVFRTVPAPAGLICELLALCGHKERLWPWCRTTAWAKVKRVALRAHIPEYLATPRALRHAFGVVAVQDRIALNLIGKWLGHSKVETTAIYTNASGPEERAIAKFMWRGLPEQLIKRRPQSFDATQISEEFGG